MNPPKQDFSHTLERVDPDEKLLAVIKKHLFGLIKLYVQAGLGMLTSIGLVLYLLPTMISKEDNPDAYGLIAMIVVIVLVIVSFMLLVATFIYRQSKIILTDKTITQTLQVGLFNKKISQLAVSSIEDVTAQKAGFFPTMLNFGRLLVETAGEQENFHFDYCPNPDHYAKLILETRQQFMSRREFEMREQELSYASYAAPQGMQPQYRQMPPQNQQPQQPQQFQQQQPAQPYYQQQANNPQFQQQPQPQQQPAPQQYPSQYPLTDTGQQEQGSSTPGTDYRGPA